jgi:hypothetical protein
MRELYQAFERVLAARGDREALARCREAVEHRATVSKLHALLEPAGFRVTMVREREVVMRFANAEALFAHHFIRMGFRPTWEEIAGPESLAAVGVELDHAAAADGAIRLTIPLAYLEATRV